MRVVRFRRAAGPAAEAGGLGPVADQVWMAGAAVGIGLAAVAGWVFPGHGLAIAYLSVMLRTAWYAASVRRGGPVLGGLLGLGLVAGAFAVLGDYVRAHALPEGRLVYLSRDAVLLGTPPYVVLGWGCAVVEVGYLALRVHARLARPAGGAGPVAVASVLASGLAGLGMGAIEVIAARAGWWKYEPTSAMLAPSVAAYAPLGEGLGFLALVPLALRALRAGPPGTAREARIVTSGIAFAATVLAAQLLAWALLR